MNNEETIIMQSNNNEKVNETTETIKEQSNGKDLAATMAAAVLGSAVGSGTVHATTTLLGNSETEETKESEETKKIEETKEPEEPKAPKEPKQNEQVAEEQPVAPAPKTEVAETKEEVTAAKIDDYTGNNNADPVTPNPEVSASSDGTNVGSNEVKVLGVYEIQANSGQMMQAAVLTNGEEVAAVVDVDYDGIADIVVVDENHNQQIDEGEVYDLRIQMTDYQQTYLAQQAQIQQEHETFSYNVDSNQPDYNNNVEPQFV